MYFIVSLPHTQKGFYFIFVVVDRFSKMAHFISCRKTIDVVQVDVMFFCEIYKLHDIPMSIVSDRDCQFLGHFWHSLWKLLGTTLEMSSAYHPSSNGQMEVVNRSLHNILRFLVGDAINSWDSKLLQAEFAHNQATNRSTGFCPFQVIYGTIPHGPISLSALPDITQSHGHAATFVESLAKIHTIPLVNLKAATTKYKDAADKHRRHVVFDIGNLVWVYFMRDRLPAHAYNKLKSKRVGPVEVLERINDNAYRLRLPAITILQMSSMSSISLVMFPTPHLLIRG